ncbi:sugar phosphate isomerase/epimerase family protein [Butyrivibrio sp. WCD3002]|uniref:sugar phosphate isomerase/epimerase family protein n=1 Tax=Butyrivibrio sp. WCD3002 TaxID=1280676 RepID=UPI0003F6DE7E|nr:sugar phosphate isomerase/epimerase family protein [Butyrivibrio sp. WCD3002]
MINGELSGSSNTPKSGADSVKKGLQQIMLGRVCKNHDTTLNALKRIKAAGYDYIELNDFMVQKSSLIVKLLTSFGGMSIGNSGSHDWHRLISESGFKVSSIQSNLGAIESDPVRIAALANSFGTDVVVITGMYRFDYSSRSEVEKLAERLNAAGKTLKDQGIRVLYHNHNSELQKVSPGVTAYDVLIEKTDPEYVNFELDTYWMTDAGADVYPIIDKLGSRLKYWHINDRGNREKGPYMTPILKENPTELGYGNMNLEGIADAIQKYGIEAVILETHMNWIQNDPVKSAEVSAEFIRSHF